VSPTFAGGRDVLGEDWKGIEYRFMSFLAILMRVYIYYLKPKLFFFSICQPVLRDCGIKTL
jgi:hypothetical protein